MNFCNTIDYGPYKPLNPRFDTLNITPLTGNQPLTGRTASSGQNTVTIIVRR